MIEERVSRLKESSLKNEIKTAIQTRKDQLMLNASNIDQLKTKEWKSNETSTRSKQIN